MKFFALFFCLLFLASFVLPESLFANKQEITTAHCQKDGPCCKEDNSKDKTIRKQKTAALLTIAQ